MTKLTPAQKRALAAVAANPKGTFHDQFPRGVDSYMMGRLANAGLVRYQNDVWDGIIRTWAAGYRLTDAGAAIAKAVQS